MKHKLGLFYFYLNCDISYFRNYNYLDTPCQLLPSTSKQVSSKKATISWVPWKTTSFSDSTPKEELNNSEPELSREKKKPQSSGTNPLTLESQETHGEPLFWKSSLWTRMSPLMMSALSEKLTLNTADSSYNQTLQFHTTSDFMEIKTQKFQVNLLSQALFTDSKNDHQSSFI